MRDFQVVVQYCETRIVSGYAFRATAETSAKPLSGVALIFHFAPPPRGSLSPHIGGGIADEAAEELAFRAAAPEGVIDWPAHTLCLKA